MATATQGTVLVVEDDDSMRSAIERLLTAAGFENVVYTSAEALLAAGAVEGALCVISDLELPSMSGIELLTRLRARGPKPPVIVITAHDTPVRRSEAERHGAAAFLAKPFLGSALLAAIEGVAERAST